MALAHCILGKYLGVVCHCFPPPLDVPTFAARCLYVRNDARDPSSERLNCGREICPVILSKFRLSLKFRDLLHAANVRHGTDCFTSPPKEGVLRVFFALKIRQLRPGLNPRSWLLKASTLPLDHRSRFIYIATKIFISFVDAVSRFKILCLHFFIFVRLCQSHKILMAAEGREITTRTKTTSDRFYVITYRAPLALHFLYVSRQRRDLKHV